MGGFCPPPPRFDSFRKPGLNRVKCKLERIYISQTTGMIKKIMIHKNNLQWFFFIFARDSFPNSHRTHERCIIKFNFILTVRSQVQNSSNFKLLIAVNFKSL